MKFGKEFLSQMVPEWHEAYMDYAYLKTLLKDIEGFRQRSNKTQQNNNNGAVLTRKLTLYRAFSGLTLRHSPSGTSSISPDIENQAISVTRNGDETYETRFLMAGEEGGEYELVYFRRLDDEFNKVEKFYKKKMKEVMKEAEDLNKQMDAMIAFRVKVDNPTGWPWTDRTIEMTRLASNVAASAASLAVKFPSGARSSRREVDHMKVINEESSHGKSNHETRDANENSSHSQTSVEEPNQIKRSRPATLQILDRVKMNNHLETPRSTIKTVLQLPKQEELKFTRENLKKVEDQLRRAFVEFYLKIRLLKSFSFLNTLAFSKIMKKYDKMTSRDATKQYMEMVDKSQFGSSDEIVQLMERVESTFIKHFANGNRSKGMRILRPKAKKERHGVTFSTGFLAGCTISLIIALVLIMRARHILGKPGQIIYMETMFPLYSLFGFIVLHTLMYAGNIYYWRKYRVNYSFIFGFKQGTELGYREVLLPSFGLGALALSAVLLNLDMEMDPRTLSYETFTELLPLFLLILVAIVFVCPFNILYRSSRFFLLTCFFHGIAAPLYKVTLSDFFLADQLTSQVQAIRSLEFYICYYGWGDFTHRQNTCKSNDVFNTFYFIVAVIPYWSRLLQCMRRWFEEKDALQGYNGLKYFLTIVAVCLRTAYSLNKGNIYWRAIAWVFSGIAALFCTYWDLVYDWGLLDRKSKNRWLRDKLLVPYTSVYYGAIGLNVLLRFAWLQTVLDYKFTFVHEQTMIAIVASLEIIRRGIWNFFRLENEHLNNVGKYRAFKSVPLPFNYDEDDDREN